MATNGSRGAAAERLVRDYLQGQGFYVMRSAGSKSPVDLIAVPPLDGPFRFTLTRLIQVKSVSRHALPKSGVDGFLNRSSMQTQLKEFRKLDLHMIYKRVAVVVHGRPHNEIFFFDGNGLPGL